MNYVSTKKNILEHYGKENVISVSYCGLQTLLRGETPSCYTSGVYGWNADVYVFNDTAICTGYRPFGGVKAPYELCQKYEKLAQDLVDELFATGQYWEADNQKRFRPLIDSFIAEVFA